MIVGREAIRHRYDRAHIGHGLSARMPNRSLIFSQREG
jgi:hypothetical protein